MVFSCVCSLHLLHMCISESAYIYVAGSQRRSYLFVQHVISNESFIVYTKSIS